MTLRDRAAWAASEVQGKINRLGAHRAQLYPAISKSVEDEIALFQRILDALLASPAPAGAEGLIGALKEGIDWIERMHGSNTMAHIKLRGALADLVAARPAHAAENVDLNKRVREALDWLEYPPPASAQNWKLAQLIRELAASPAPATPPAEARDLVERAREFLALEKRSLSGEPPSAYGEFVYACHKSLPALISDLLAALPAAPEVR